MPDHNKSKPSFTDNLANLVGAATTDIRHKLVDEAWFGRSAAGEPSNYYESFWKRHGPPKESELGPDVFQGKDGVDR